MRFLAVYQHLFNAYGHQHWWPGETPFEIMVGAVLTQNTAWTNVEKAIANLIAADALSAERINTMPAAALAELIRPAGYFNVKARRLQNFCAWYLAQGGFDVLQAWSTPDLRTGLLSVNGVGPETADDMMLYAFERPVFVIDAYTRRIFMRLGLVAGDENYEQLRSEFETRLGAEFKQDTAAHVQLFNEYHALIVRHAKEACRTKPACEECCLRKPCAWVNN